MPLMRKCHVYTMNDKCPVCGGKSKTAHPPRFAQSDRYGKYRRMAKQKE